MDEGVPININPLYGQGPIYSNWTPLDQFGVHNAKFGVEFFINRRVEAIE